MYEYNMTAYPPGPGGSIQIQTVTAGTPIYMYIYLHKSVRFQNLQKSNSILAGIGEHSDHYFHTGRPLVRRCTSVRPYVTAAFKNTINYLPVWTGLTEWMVDDFCLVNHDV